MKIIKVLGLICFLTVGILAQTGANVSGRVTENNTGIGNALISLQSFSKRGESYGATAGADGNFSFSNIPAGNYLFRVDSNKLNGERIVWTDIIRISDGENKTVNVDFSQPLPVRENVTVIASGTFLPESDVSKTVNIIDAQEMRDRADFSLTDTLRSIPGFRVQQLGGFGRTANIKTRGLRNQDTAILIDGVRFRDASAITGDASPFLSDFTLTSVSRIEVLRGSGSSLYGTNAIGGTIDFQTPRPTSGFHGSFSGAFGDLGLRRFRTNLGDGTNDGKFGFNLGVSRTVYTRGIDGQDDAHNTNFQSRIEYNPISEKIGYGLNISARFFVSDAYVRLNSNPDTFGTLPANNATILNANQGVNFVFDANDPDNSQKSKFFNGQVFLTYIINQNLVFQSFYSGLKTSRKNENGVLGVGFQSASTSIFDGTIQTANGKFNWTPGKYNQITFGYEFEHEKYGNDGFTPSGAGNFFTRVKQSSNTVFAQDLVSLMGGRLQLAGGFRAQFFNLNLPAFSVTNAPYSNLTLENPPNAYTFDGAVSYFFETTGTKIRAHIGNGYRVPSLYERFGTFYSSFSSNFTALGDPNLKPEKSIAFDFGVEQNLFKNRARLTAVYFYTQLDETIGYGNVVPNIGTTPRPFGGYLNTEGGISRGGEFSANVKATSSTDIFTSYTFTNSDQRVPQVSGNPNISTLGIPKHQFTFVATQRIKDFWINFDFLGTGSYLAPIFSNSVFRTYVYRFDGNRRADLTLGYTFKLRNEKLNLRLFGTAENLFDYEYYENGFRTVGRNGRIGLAFGF